jgi:3'-5' exoribonuclease
MLPPPHSPRIMHAARLTEGTNMPRIAVAQMRDGDHVDQPFVLASKQIASTANSKLYIKAECRDATGSIHCRVWNASREMYDQLPNAGYVLVRGRIETYQGHLQMVADTLAPVADLTKLDLSDLVKHTQKSIPDMLARVREIMSKLQDKELKALIDSFFADTELMKKFQLAPAAVGMHHAWLGGVLEHTLSLLELATVICPRYPDIDQDLVLAGLFLHDIAKTAELSYTVGFDYTDEGRLIGHVVTGAIWIDQRARTLHAAGTTIRKELVMVLQHIILSHHGEPEFGAAVTPKTPEAILVNLIDNLDAKTQMALDAVAAPTENNTWTEYHKAFNSKLYRPQITIKD